MQSPTVHPRDHLTVDQVAALIESDLLEVSAGIDLLDNQDRFVDDLAGHLSGGSVSRRMDDTIHGTCTLTITRALAWSSDRVRPWMRLAADGLDARFDLGVYLLATPERTADQDPPTYTVQGYDKLLVLNTPIGVTYRVPAGTGVLTAAKTVIELTGETKVAFTGMGDEATLPSDRVWVLDQENTYLKIVNDLLEAGGYTKVWCDHRGYYRTGLYQQPADQATEWTFRADDHARTIIVPHRTETVDVFDTPNEWVFVRSDPTLGPPTEANGGVWRYTNQSVGPASVDARKGLIKRRVEFLDAITPTALQYQGQKIIDEDLAYSTFLSVQTGPFPLAWHNDVYALAASGITRRWLSRSWSLPLDGRSPMTHEWRLI